MWPQRHKPTELSLIFGRRRASVAGYFFIASTGDEDAFTGQRKIKTADRL